MSVFCAVLVVGLVAALTEGDVAREEWIDAGAWGMREWRWRYGRRV